MGLIVAWFAVSFVLVAIFSLSLRGDD